MRIWNKGWVLVGIQIRVCGSVCHATFVSSIFQVRLQKSFPLCLRQWWIIESIQRQTAIPHVASMAISNGFDALEFSQENHGHFSSQTRQLCPKQFLNSYHWIIIEIGIPSFEFLNQVQSCLIGWSSIPCPANRESFFLKTLIRLRRCAEILTSGWNAGSNDGQQNQRSFHNFFLY